MRIICLLCFLNLQVFAQNYSIEKKGMDEIAADYAEEIIQKNTPSDGRQYAYTLSQNGNEFVINCKVMPGDITVEEQTDDLWNQMEHTIIRAINRVTQSSSHTQQQTPSIITETPASQQTTVIQQNNPTIDPTPRPVQQPAQNYMNIYDNPQINPNGNMGYMHSQGCTIEDVRNGKAKIGEKICFSDGSCGVIFLLDGNGHGLAISLDETEVKWQNTKRVKDCQDIYQLMTLVSTKNLDGINLNV